MKGLRLYKKEKLCSAKDIDLLFSKGTKHSTCFEYPLRAVWRENPMRHSDAPVAFVISVPKKRLKHAVDRVLIRRRIREAYRLARNEYTFPEGKLIDLALVYVSDSLKDFKAISDSVRSILGNISGEIEVAEKLDNESERNE